MQENLVNFFIFIPTNEVCKQLPLNIKPLNIYSIQFNFFIFPIQFRVSMLLYEQHIQQNIFIITR